MTYPVIVLSVQALVLFLVFGVVEQLASEAFGYVAMGYSSIERYAPEPAKRRARWLRRAYQAIEYLFVGSIICAACAFWIWSQYYLAPPGGSWDQGSGPVAAAYIICACGSYFLIWATSRIILRYWPLRKLVTPALRHWVGYDYEDRSFLRRYAPPYGAAPQA